MHLLEPWRREGSANDLRSYIVRSKPYFIASVLAEQGQDCNRNEDPDQAAVRGHASVEDYKASFFIR